MDEFRAATWEYGAGRVFTEDLPMIAARALPRHVGGLR
jgi:hypothetical protein